MEVEYKDKKGFKYRVDVPAEFRDQPQMGIVIGPPDLESLGLPKKYELILNNQLYDRKLFTWSDVRRRPEEIRAALKAMFRVHELAIISLYKEDKK